MRAFETEKTEVAEIDRSVYDIKDKVNAAFEVNSGLTAEIVEQISKEKHDPDWMREFRLKALDIYNKASIPNWGPSLEGLDMRNIVTYVRPNTEMRGKWSEVPDDIKNTFERLGIPQAERSSLAGVGAQYDSEVVYHNVKEEVAAQGVVYTDMESALTGPYADMVKEHFMKCVPPTDLNTKRARVEKGGTIEWVSGSFGSHTGCLYPMSVLQGEGARMEFTGITFAGAGQDLDTGAKVVHAAPNTTSHISTKSIARDGGVSNFRSSVVVLPNAKGSKSSVSCESLMLDDRSRSDTIPAMDIRCDAVDVGHEAKIGRISEEAIFYLMSRGMTEEDARALIVGGFAEPIAKELPLEYAVEMNNLIHLEMKGSIG